MIVNGVGGAVPNIRTRERFGKPVPGSIPTVIRSYKSAVTKQINDLRGTPGLIVWQRNYYEHIIRNAREYDLICQYIIENPLRWELDRFNPGKKITK